MKRLLAFAATIVLGLGILVPAALAASPLAHTGRVVISTQGDVTIPAGEHADVVVVVQGAAHIQGEVNTLVIVDGVAHLAGARLETVVAVTSSVEVADGTIIHGELQRLDSSVHQTGNVTIEGGITDMSSWLVEAWAVLAPALVMLWIGFALTAVLAALLLAALAGRQVRAAERLISTEPLVTGLVGLLGAILLPVLAVLLVVTVVGAPLGLGFLFGVLPLLAYAGYLVAAIWTGEWLLRVTGPAQDRERPFLAAVIGVIVLGAVGLVPIIGLVVTVASVLGFGALLRLGYRTIRGESRPVAGIALPAPAPTGA